MFRVDEFFTTILTGENYAALVDVVKILLVLSHGQASVERGFSVNKEVEVEILHEPPLVAEHIICDHLRALGGVFNLPITKKHLAAATQSRHKLEKYLQDQKDKNKMDEEQRKRKGGRNWGTDSCQ
ncbi:unnamed protein product [Porites evermanni]|uniref:Uncharacterized protein n=1 Tax=Porites evermanni TaxID=104178 RepID=A0ABN8NFT3_9CNID|nr:unnamed protein product [Porites evermanni]CAH3047550.1 unnamed protein product [Porites evermanni]